MAMKILRFQIPTYVAKAKNFGVTLMRARGSQLSLQFIRVLVNTVDKSPDHHVLVFGHLLQPVHDDRIHLQLSETEKLPLVTTV